MNKIQKYLNSLFEYTELNRMGIGQGQRGGMGGQGSGFGQRGGAGRKPSPVAAYELVYGKLPPFGMRGQYPGQSDHKVWNNLYVDAHLENKWLNDLSSIKEIEMRASCEGHDKNWVSFIVFRVMPDRDNDIKYLDKIKNFLNRGITKCNYEIGQQGRPRIIVAAKLWYGQPGWKIWWSTLSSKVKKAVSIK